MRPLQLSQNNSACVQNIIFLYLYFIIATFTVFALWSLAGFAFVGHKAFDETCKMMELHYQGNPNDYVTDNLPCEDLERAGDSVTEAQLGANAAVEAGNEQLERMLQITCTHYQHHSKRKHVNRCF